MPDPVEGMLESEMRFVHKDGTRAVIYLPAPASTAAAAMKALARIGFEFDVRPAQPAPVVPGETWDAAMKPVERATTEDQRAG